MTSPQRRLPALGVVTILLILSLGAAYVLFAALTSTAVFKTEKMNLGGAIAGFFVVFLLLRSTYYREAPIVKEPPLEEKVKLLQGLVEEEARRQLLDSVPVPTGFKAELYAKPDLRFAFCYPETWLFDRLPQNIQYAFIKDTETSSALGFARNMNLVISDVTREKGPLDALLDTARRQALSFLPKSSLVFNESFLLQGLPAHRYRIDYVPNDAPAPHTLALYQVLVADRLRRHLFTLSFTTLAKDFEKSRPVFEEIVTTFRV